MIVGGEDAFEREYKEKFRTLLSSHGEFVNYERDRAARDIGIHLTRKKASGQESVSGSLVWFQLKGKMENSLSRKDYERSSGPVSVSLSVRHLRFWFRQPQPTYLALYVQSIERFLILDLKKYVANTWGAEIFKLEQKTATVKVPRRSTLDRDTIRRILDLNDTKSLAEAFELAEDDVGLGLRDCELIYNIGNPPPDKETRFRIVFLDWQTKLRSQLTLERGILKKDWEWERLREHWHFMLMLEGIGQVFPYLDFLDYNEFGDWDYSDDYFTVKLPDGTVVAGEDCYGGEYHLYYIDVQLNEYGNEILEWLEIMEKVNAITINPDERFFVNVAPWEAENSGL
jgi:Domain of unknown function (DUF4365)